MSPLHPSMLCAKFGWNLPNGCGEEYENVKSLRTDRQTDGRSEKLTWTLSSGELKSDCNNTWSFYCEEKQCTQHPTIPYYGVTATYISHSHKFSYESV